MLAILSAFIAARDAAREPLLLDVFKAGVIVRELSIELLHRVP
jgi:hypothetical protein